MRMKKIVNIVVLIMTALAIAGGVISCKKSVKLSVPENIIVNKDAKTLTWTAIDNASGYSVQIDTQTPIVNESTSYPLSSLTTAGTYKLKVKALGDGKNYSDSDWSEDKIYIVAAKLSTPTGLTVDASAKTLAWNTVTNANGYSLQSNGEKLKDVDKDTVSCSLEMTIAGTYKLQIKALGDNTDYVDSDWSQEATYIISETLSKPTDLTVNSTEKILSWTIVENARGYALQIDGGEWIEIAAADITKNNVTLTYSLEATILETGVHKLRIKALGDETIYLESEESSEATYIISETLSKPTGLTIEETTKTLTWTKVNNASGYSLQIDGGEWTKIAAADITVNANDIVTYVLKITEAGFYELKIKALGNGTIYFDSEPSDTVEYTKTEKLATPSVFTVNWLTKTLTWAAIDNASGYSVQINTQTPENIGFFASYYFSSFPEGEYKLKVKALGDETYYFSSDWSEEVILTVDAPERTIDDYRPLLTAADFTVGGYVFVRKLGTIIPVDHESYSFTGHGIVGSYASIRFCATKNEANQLYTAYATNSANPAVVYRYGKMVITISIRSGYNAYEVMLKALEAMRLIPDEADEHN